MITRVCYHVLSFMTNVNSIHAETYVKQLFEDLYCYDIAFCRNINMITTVRYHIDTWGRYFKIIWIREKCYNLKSFSLWKSVMDWILRLFRRKSLRRK